MRLALLGKSGALIGLDYRGETVLAAYEPVAELNLGIVAKIDLAEVRAPFVRAGLTAIGFTVVVVLVGVLLFMRVGGPLVTALERRSRELEDSMVALRESEDRFRTTFELAGAGIVHGSTEGRFISINQRFCEIAGYDRNELLEMSFLDITHPDDVEADLANVRRALDGEIDTYSMEKRYLRKDSSIVWVSLVVTLVRNRSGDPSHFIGVVENITDRKRSERALQSSLAEKEVLLREIHHRVKNNMQVISSLLNLQSRGIDDPRLAKMFEESQNRVRAMALIHEILYDSGHLVQIDLQEYVTKLATSLVRMYGNEPGMIELRVATGGIALEIDDSVPCGLVINELISNSLKYAFEDGRAGVIKIEAARANDGQIVLVVSDDGVGIPAEVDIRNTGSMGMRLVIGLVENQLGGHVAFDRSQGTCFTITFTPTRPGPGR
ncbi:MAG: PAS domain S-box protein [Candidatus Aminicenantes bacterium]|nr:MAG: PAS domain S-box protein [Candidatus Aminicenantes bacterium]